MSLGPRLDLRQSQSLVMTPQLQQAIRLLALSNLEVETFLAEEIEKNPLLEGGGPEDSDAPVEAAAPAEAEPVADLGEPTPDDADFSEEIFHHDGASDSAGSGSGSASEDGIDFDSFAGAAETLADHLVAQAGEVLDGIDLAIATQLIDAIDEAGYLTVTLFDAAQRLGVPTGQVEAVLTVIHGFEPTGVGARSLSECLSLQAREADRYDPCMKVLLDNLELLAGGRIAHLQRLCGVDDEDMADMIRELRGYDPKPGLRFGSAPVVAVTPDLFVNRTAKGWRVEINNATLPRVLVDRRYHAELARSASDREGKAWLSDALASANWLIKALDQRQRTIIKVATEIVKAQEGFFLHGVAHLKPLTLRTVADAVQLHESTVSRVTSNKYLSCPRGTFELKYFFTSGIGSSDGGEASSALAVKAAIKTLITSEAADAILSDDTLVDLLRDKGFEIARRTVAKYREALGLGSSVQRRRARAIETKAA
ncbi:RNA polymerase factor sigma-54 [Sphingomonas sp.]|uniref:RNA polymerase factor sigma-54 n=1 Tax=Sphingomonas sp. TaxID=28214 RepID=UPI0025FC28CA|nr:RNA polymerase factor sigma-54 [Sphingomonas sp.]